MKTSYDASSKWTGILLFFVFSMQTCCNALNAYLFYENANCTGTKSIEGDLVYQYDESSMMNTNGFIVDEYSGPCNYFGGGYHDFLNDSNDTDYEYMTEGFCMTCDGVVGCSASYDECDDFYTIVPTNDTGYAEANAQDNNAHVISSARSFQKQIYSELFAEDKLPLYPFYAGALAMVGLLGLAFMFQDPIMGFFEKKLTCLEKEEEEGDGDFSDGDDTTLGDNSKHYVAIV